MHISRIIIDNFRNFQHLDVKTSRGILLVGENRTGKSNLVHALRLVLDPFLPYSMRHLRMEDFWDGLGKPGPHDSISIAVEITDIQDLNAKVILADCLVPGDPSTARITYEFRPKADADEPSEPADYEVSITGGAEQRNDVNRSHLTRIPLDYIQALRNAPNELLAWQRNPLRPLLERLEGEMDEMELEEITAQFQAAGEKLVGNEDVQELATEIRDHIKSRVGAYHAADYDLNLVPADGPRLVRSMRIHFDELRRTMQEASDGSSNVVFLALKELQTRRQHADGARTHTFSCIEEPEAHLHPHLQRLVFSGYMRDRFAVVPESEQDESFVITTNSPHIASVAPLRSIVYLRRQGAPAQTVAKSLANAPLTDAEVQDLERYLDVSRSEFLFARGVILVEGISEQLLLPRLAREAGINLDEQGVSIVNVEGTNFTPFVKALGPQGLDKPFVVLTDSDEGKKANGINRIKRLLDALGQDLPADNGVEQAGKDRGIFLAEGTFEAALWKAGLHQPITAALQTSSNQALQERAAARLASPATVDVEQLLKDVSAVGKGRIAQRLAAHQGKLPEVPYVVAALGNLQARL